MRKIWKRSKRQSGETAPSIHSTGVPGSVCADSPRHTYTRQTYAQSLVPPTRQWHWETWLGTCTCTHTHTGRITRAGGTAHGCLLARGADAEGREGSAARRTPTLFSKAGFSPHRDFGPAGTGSQPSALHSSILRKFLLKQKQGDFRLFMDTT